VYFFFFFKGRKKEKEKTQTASVTETGWHLIHRSYVLNQTAITHYNVYNSCGAMFFFFQVLHYKVIGFEPGQQVKCTTRAREIIERRKKKV
jgi:hypothetical protein